MYQHHSGELIVRFVCGCVSNRYMERFDLPYPYPYAVSVSASAHIESLLCVYTITIFCRMPHAASACRIRTYGILALNGRRKRTMVILYVPIHVMPFRFFFHLRNVKITSKWQDMKI